MVIKIKKIKKNNEPQMSESQSQELDLHLVDNKYST